MQYLTVKHQLQQSNLVKHKDTYMILVSNKRLRTVWLRISLQLQDIAKAKPDKEPTPKSLTYQLHYLVMQSV